MIKYIMILFLVVGSANAHEMTPTYPELKQSHVGGILKTTLKMFNKRSDVKYYEIGVFDKDMKPIPFVSSYKLINMEYLAHVTFDVYIREEDRERAVYICSQSKMKKEDLRPTMVTSRICSKFSK